ncbi:MAG: amidohydrolase family protein [Acidobacteriota bacterium]
MRVDSHHHFWSYDPAEYGWMSPGMGRIQRDFLPPDLKTEIEAAGIDRVVSVQARQTLEETEWLLALAAEFDFIAGVVGWVPLVSPRVRGDLERLARNTPLKGVRHLLQDEPDDDYMLKAEFNQGVGLLRDFGLTYDILIFERHLSQTIEFVDRHPHQVFILDHIAKPRIRDGVISPWKENMRELARRKNVFCKVSGMATEAHWDAFTEDDLRPYLEVVLDAFGPERLMFGSDWPVCLLACEYERWARVVRAFCKQLSHSERARIEGGTALDAYRLA